MQAPPEKLGSFYLGAEYDLKRRQRSDVAVNYDARDLTTHAICVGMTGSGKTGLCLGLLEEAALDRVPAILVDPKGDLTNLLLQFPTLAPADFQAWINLDDARRKGQTAEVYAQATAEQWRTGLADWGITPARIRTLQATVEYTIFTPGSDAGVPINILGSLAAPKLNFTEHGELVHEQISGTVSALLGLVGIDADPVRSREAILLSNIFQYFWAQNQDLDLKQLILAIQTPPIRQLGVFDVETFFPAKARFDLAMAFNNLIAAPSFQSWLQGEPLDIDRLYFTAEGKPRHSIFYIAHLSDSERMFFMTLLLENVLTWVRRQSGTTSLRALLYIDEVFGYFPPTAEPSSKRPLLTLLKQARAFGLGVVLVTQNPMDLDYKGLSNAGTWFIGKLQAERDKARVVEGLQGAIAESGGNLAVNYDDLITQLSNRIFLMHNIHADRPVVFHTRWAMSYLRGPLTRPQVRQLMADRVATMAAAVAPGSTSPTVTLHTTVARANIAPGQPTAAPAETGASVEPATPVQPSALSPLPLPAGFAAAAPALDPDVPQVYLPLVLTAEDALHTLAQATGLTLQPESVHLVYEPAILSNATIRFVDRKRQWDARLEKLLLAPAPTSVEQVDWSLAEALSIAPHDLRQSPAAGATQQAILFAPVPAAANSVRELNRVKKELADWLYYNCRLTIQVHEALGIHQGPQERARDFAIRLQQAARERRDREVDALEEQFSQQISRLEEKVRKTERTVTAAETAYNSHKQQAWIGVGERVLGWMFGRRNRRTLSSVASRRRTITQAAQRLEENHAEIQDLRQAIAGLEAELKEQTVKITHKWANLLDDLDQESLSPRRTDVDVKLVALAWLPSWVISYADGPRLRTDTIAAYQLPAVG